MPTDNLPHNNLAALLIASRNGSNDALAELAKVLRTKAVAFFIVKKVSRDLIDELAQITMESILGSLHKVTKPESIESFVYTVCIREWQDHLIRKKNRMELSNNNIDEEYESIKHVFPVRNIDGKINLLFDTDGRIDLMAVLYKMPMKYREAILMKFFEQQNYEEISERLDISMNTARKWVSRGISIMRTIIKK